MLCGLAWNIDSMIVFRALQGLLGASMIPTVFTSSFHYFQGTRRVYSAAVVGTIASIAPTLGPVIGGWITDTLNWHWLFYINLVPGLVDHRRWCRCWCGSTSPTCRCCAAPTIPGIVLMAVGLGTLEYVLEEGTRWNWFDDRTIRTCAWIAGISLVLFVVRSLTYRNPVVDLRALSNRNFALGCLLSFVTGVGIFTTIYLTPLFLGYVRGFSAWQTGVGDLLDRRRVAARHAGLYRAGAPLRHALADDVRPGQLRRWRCGATASSRMTGARRELLLPQVLRGFPQVFAVAPSVTLGLGSLPPERLKYASGLFNMMRNLGGAVGIAVSAAIINDQTNLHFQRIAAHLTPANGAMERFCATASTQRYGALPGSPVAGHDAALKQLWHLAYREASTLAFADAFRAIMLAFIVATLLVPLMRKVATGPAPSTNAH